MHVDIRKSEDVVIVDLKGKLTAGLGDQILRETIDALLAEGWKKIVLNLSDVTTLDSAGLGELVAGVAHEINNPLAFVLSHLDTIKRSQAQFLQALAQPLPEGAEPHWARAQSRLDEAGLGLERIRDLVLKLRTFSRLDEGERKRVNVRECIDSVLTILQHRTSDRIEIEMNVGEPEQLDCYPALLNQVLLKACDPDPQKRHASVRKLKDELESLDQGRSIMRVRQLERALRWTRASLLSALLAGGAIFFAFQAVQAKRSAASLVRERQIATVLAQGNEEVKRGDIPSALTYFAQAALWDKNGVKEHQLRLGSALLFAPRLLGKCYGSGCAPERPRPWHGGSTTSPGPSPSRTSLLSRRTTFASITGR